jgi:hypothetical protein
MHFEVDNMFNWITPTHATWEKVYNSISNDKCPNGIIHSHYKSPQFDTHVANIHFDIRCPSCCHVSSILQGQTVMAQYYISAVPMMSCTQEAISRSNLKCHYSIQYLYRLVSRFLAIEMVLVTTPSLFSKSQSVWLQYDSRTEEATVWGNNVHWDRIF